MGKFSRATADFPVPVVIVDEVLARSLITASMRPTFAMARILQCVRHSHAFAWEDE